MTADGGFMNMGTSVGLEETPASTLPQFVSAAIPTSNGNRNQKS
jgi:hypothetical protein